MFFKRIRRKILLCLIDILLFLFIYSGVSVAYSILKPSPIDFGVFLVNGLTLCVLIFICRIVWGLYSNIWRYAATTDYLILIISDIIAGILYLLVSRFIFPLINVTAYPFWMTIAYLTLFSLGSLGMRFCYQVIMKHRNLSSNKTSAQKKNLAIVGAGQLGVSLADEYLYNKSSKYVPYCFFDNNPEKIGKKISGMKVFGYDENVGNLIDALSISEIIIAINNILPEDLNQLYILFSKSGKPVKIFDQPLDSQGLKNLPREIKIEDLLFRKQQKLNKKEYGEMYSGKTILITGAGGSIGSELSRQVAEMNPKKMILLDIYENTVYDVQQQLRMQHGNSLDFSVEIVSITNREGIDAIFKKYMPDIVIHAAAHKHVPLMENNCVEAVRNNVFGTLNVVEAAEKYNVKKFLMISTDKAVNPTNIMGATKRMCEMIIHCRSNSNTEFIAVRFGNVLGSNGSVIPLFKEQIARGGPVTITDKRVTRYFMTIKEAVSLVLCTGAMANGNEIFVLDMGRPVKIIDLAENLIRLSGHVPYEEIEIREIGLREGEKLYEELLIKDEKMKKTDNDKIFVEQDSPLQKEDVDRKLQILQECLDRTDLELNEWNELVRAKMRECVETYFEPDEINKLVK